MENLKLGVMRNPVTDLVAMMSMTEIPEWIPACGLNKAISDLTKVTDEDYVQLRKKSPVNLLQNVKCRVVMLLGDKVINCVILQDLRVPPGPNGIAYVHALRNRGGDVFMERYPDELHGFEAEGVIYRTAIVTLREMEKQL